ncbi:Prefoldin [Protomyces lactucae-debilis]|uniref:Prefoldin n=1 Tax=Protomyces lactucae-debilis TaxID=2754530 RepID=A0A1Y2FMD6_PROLT|nr:Prefoldin [Protomyces lactucae-debilis]ORY84386.1 Prefoldin [Protomyces lactucae-debilis]
MAETQHALQRLSNDYRTLQGQLQDKITGRQTLESQVAENRSVLAELSKATSNNTVYKLIGPVLMPQDLQEAKQNVARRIELLQQELDKAELTIRTVQEQQNSVRLSIIKLQQESEGAPGQAVSA